MINLRDLQEYDPSKKTGKEGYERAVKVVRYLRMCLKPVVDRKRAEKNKSYLFGVQDMSDVKKMFKEPEKSGVNFLQCAVMEKYRNVLIAEQEDTGIQFRLQSTDPLATNEQQMDLELLQNRGWIEPMMSGLNKMVGLPPFKMSNEKDLFNGNVDEFDKMGLNPNNSQDLNYFFAYHYRLLHEMVGEEPVNYFIKYNELSEMIPAWYNDIIAVKCCCGRAYVNEITGAIDYRYLAPENVSSIPGIRRDYKDASAIDVQQTISVGDMIKLIGNEFDFVRDMNLLLQAVNKVGGTSFTGLLDGKNLYFGTNSNSMMQFADFMLFNINIGYIEWKEINASSHNVWRSAAGRLGVKPVNYYEPEKPNSKYERDCRYYETTYKAYYINTGQYEVPLFKYGPLNYQMIAGAEDEYSNFSIFISQEYGKSAIEVAMPFIDPYEKAMKKLEYMIVRAKPPGRMWSYESMLTMAKGMFPGIPVEKAINNLMIRFNGMSDELYAIPTVNGNPTGGGGQMNYDLPHGLSQSVMQFRDLAQWYDGLIMDKIGISPLRAAYQPGEKDGLGLQQQSTAYSEKATAYMHRMVTRLVKNIAIRTLSYTQDIIQFGDKNTLPYKFLLQALGDSTMEELNHLKKVCFHRYNIFVEGMASQQDKREAEMMAMQALQNKEISYEQWLLIKSCASPKKAIMVLAYEKKRLDRVRQEEQQAAAQAQSALEDKRHANKMQEITAEGQLGIQREDRRGMWLNKVAETNGQMAIEKQSDKLSVEPQIQAQKSEAKINEAIAANASQEMAAMPVT